MTSHHDAHGPGAHDRRRSDPGPWVVRILMIALVGLGAYYVIAEHGAHVLSAWPLLILLLCPLLHLFTHGGHGGHSGHGGRNAGESDNG